MAGSEDLAQDRGAQLPTLVILRSSSEPVAVVSQPVPKSEHPRPKGLDLTLCLGKLGAVPPQAGNAKRPRLLTPAGQIRLVAAHRAPGRSRSAQRSGYCHGPTSRGRFRIMAVCSSSCTTKRSTRR